MTRTERRAQACCYDCGRRYGDEYGFPDLLVPTDVWKKIGPTGSLGGLLCPSCIARRCALAGIECEAFWGSGPFCTENDENWLENQERIRTHAVEGQRLRERVEHLEEAIAVLLENTTPCASLEEVGPGDPLVRNIDLYRLRHLTGSETP